MATEVIGEVEPDGAVEVVGDDDGVAGAGDEGRKVVADGFAEDVEHGIDAHRVDDLDVAGAEGGNIALFIVFWVRFLASCKIYKAFGGAVSEIGPRGDVFLVASVAGGFGGAAGAGGVGGVAEGHADRAQFTNGVFGVEVNGHEHGERGDGDIVGVLEGEGGLEVEGQLFFGGDSAADAAAGVEAELGGAGVLDEGGLFVGDSGHFGCTSEGVRQFTATEGEPDQC